MYAKLTYLLTCIICLISSCSSDTADDIVYSKDAEMSFNVSGLSRSSVTTDIDKFAVYGDMKFIGDNSTISPSIVFNNTQVVNIDGKWCYDGTQYWFPNHEHSFVAISPVSVLEADAVPTYSDSKLSFTYTIPVSGGILSSNSDVRDILIATHRRYYESSKTSDNSITLSFSHLMSLINLAPAFDDNILSSDAYVLIHQLEFSGIKTKSRFNIQPAPRITGNQTDDMIIGTDAQEEGGFTIRFGNPRKIKNNAGNVSLFDDNDAIIMIPQDLTADSDAKVTLTYTISGEGSMHQVSLPLNSQRWESGNRYLYKFIIERTGVKFNNCEINPWNLIEGEDITVD